MTSRNSKLFFTGSEERLDVWISRDADVSFFPYYILVRPKLQE